MHVVTRYSPHPLCCKSCLRARAQKQLKQLAMSPTSTAYTALRDSIASADLSSVEQHLFAEMDVNSDGALEKDEIR